MYGINNWWRHSRKHTKFSEKWYWCVLRKLTVKCNIWYRTRHSFLLLWRRHCNCRRVHRFATEDDSDWLYVRDCVIVCVCCAVKAKLMALQLLWKNAATRRSLARSSMLTDSATELLVLSVFALGPSHSLPLSPLFPSPFFSIWPKPLLRFVSLPLPLY